MANNILFGTQSIDKILFGQSEVSKIYLGQTLVYQAGSEPPTPGPSADPILANNSWETIAQVCAAGQASNYWALGDTKTDVGTDGVTRTFRICDMSGMYGKNAVFEQVELTERGAQWNISSNTDDDGAYNDYNISIMRSTKLPALLANYSLELQGIITNTTYKVAKNGNASPMVILDLTDKLFLPAERELYASRLRSVQEEWDALTRFALYALPENDNNNFRKKYKPSLPNDAYNGWERSPYSGNGVTVCQIARTGESGTSSANDYSNYAPCFALGPVATISFTIAGTSYQAEQGMTWAEWVASAYNTAGFVVTNGYVYENSNSEKHICIQDTDIPSTDQIIANTSYVLINQPIGGGGAIPIV